ncbi:MAG TPA: hypothetical protein DCF91_05665 [Porphyromonadaceae bacterium]|nr:hypothetical protein [Porphyromonadaceae bacterium]
MTVRNRVDHLLIDIKHLEEQISSGRDAEILPVSFFSEAFAALSKLAVDLQNIEVQQIEDLKKALESRTSVIPEWKPAVTIDDFEPLPTIENQDKEIKKENEHFASQIKIKEEVSIDTEPIKQMVEVKEVESTPPPVLEQVEIEEKIVEPVAAPLTNEHIDITPIKEEVIEVEKEIVQEEVVITNETTSNTPEHNNIPLYELIEKKRLADFRKAFNLNDRFRFRRELFGGDENKMNQAIEAINTIETLNDALAYLELNFNWNREDEPVKEFITLLEKRYL